MTDHQEQLLVHLLRQGDWSDAIAYYREETGRDTETARLVVSRLARRYGLDRHHSRTRMLLIGVATSAVVAWWWL